MKHTSKSPDVLLLKRKGHKRHHRSQKPSYARWFWGFLFIGVILGGAYMIVEFQMKTITVQNIQHEMVANMEAILAALDEYHRDKGTYPPAYEMNDRGERTFSWRVAILPYFLDANGNPRYMDLYDSFNREQPWDHKDNWHLLEKMPREYRSPLSKNTVENEKATYLTNYLTIRNLRSVFPTDRAPVSKARITDPLDSTVAVIEVSDEEAIEWTRPDDFEFDPLHEATAAPRTFREDAILVGMCNGKAKQLPITVNVKEMFGKPEYTSEKLVEENPWVGPFLRDNDSPRLGGNSNKNENSEAKKSATAEVIATSEDEATATEEIDDYRPGQPPKPENEKE
ncbi:MAG: DUF1559 domain-containing protein [Planctomycetia bacterium]|nr:DUF1559 domain-containing protein [Planctomycetia bacterium]